MWLTRFFTKSSVSQGAGVDSELGQGHTYKILNIPSLDTRKKDYSLMHATFFLKRVNDDN